MVSWPFVLIWLLLFLLLSHCCFYWQTLRNSYCLFVCWGDSSADWRRAYRGWRSRRRRMIIFHFVFVSEDHGVFVWESNVTSIATKNPIVFSLDFVRAVRQHFRYLAFDPILLLIVMTLWAVNCGFYGPGIVVPVLLRTYAFSCCDNRAELGMDQTLILTPWSSEPLLWNALPVLFCLISDRLQKSCCSSQQLVKNHSRYKKK